ncbi:MAG TPA: HAMP domain-containing sensor histidine kinase, partial [Flavobacteriales bacterium]|nr:HAMP domain-containing sensor histidine kinase [Flavobacteriales bacterium]
TRDLDFTNGSGPMQLIMSDFSGPDTLLIPHEKKGRFGQNTIIKVELRDSSAANVEREIKALVPGNPAVMHEMVQSLRVLISRNEQDSSNVKVKYDMHLEGDTGLLKTAFVKRMREYAFAVNWQMRSGNETKKEGEFYFSTVHKGKYFGALITGFNSFLFKRIAPQILFALLLVALTTLAFVLSYRSMRSQQRLNALRQEFISNMSHELKTPLSTAKVTIEALKTYNSEKRIESAGEYLDIAYAELNRLDELINEVLNTSIMESGQAEINPVKTDLDALVRLAINAFHVRFKELNAVVKYDSSGPVTVMADALHIQGVITNLIDNSLKYAGEIHPVITINLNNTGETVRLSISDNGPGIPDEYLDKVFDKFFRVPAFNKHNTKGYGLGLNYARLVMEKHGNTISVQNNEFAGCTFTMTLTAA